MKKLQDKVAVVTGGGSGIGRAICLEFAREGAHVVVISNVEKETENVAQEVRSLGREGIAVLADVTDAERIKSIADDVNKKFGITEHFRSRTGDTAEKFKQEKIASTCPQKRLLDPAEIANMAVYLASDAARGVTGQSMNVDGGLVLF